MDDCFLCGELGYSMLSFPGCRNCWSQITYCENCFREHNVDVLEKIEEKRNCHCMIRSTENFDYHEDEFITSEEHLLPVPQWKCRLCECREKSEISVLKGEYPCDENFVLLYCKECMRNRKADISDDLEYHYSCQQC